MDIGTKKEPGRELGKAEVDEIGGAHIAPIPDDTAPGYPGDATGGPSGAPVDYSNGN